MNNGYANRDVRVPLALKEHQTVYWESSVRGMNNRSTNRNKEGTKPAEEY